MMDMGFLRRVWRSGSRALRENLPWIALYALVMTGAALLQTRWQAPFMELLRDSPASWPIFSRLMLGIGLWGLGLMGLMLLGAVFISWRALRTALYAEASGSARPAGRFWAYAWRSALLTLAGFLIAAIVHAANGAAARGGQGLPTWALAGITLLVLSHLSARYGLAVAAAAAGDPDARFRTARRRVKGRYWSLFLIYALGTGVMAAAFWMMNHATGPTSNAPAAAGDVLAQIRAMLEAYDRTKAHPYATWGAQFATQFVTMAWTVFLIAPSAEAYLEAKARETRVSVF